MDIRLARIDSRLIHGQVVTKWVKQTAANKILIIDDVLAKDAFMLSIYKMAAPSDIPVEVLSVEDAVAAWKSGELNSKLFILFKDVQTAYASYKQGFPLETIQVGGLGSEGNKKKVYGPIYFDEEDIRMLSEMNENNVSVTLHQVPEEASMSLEKALSKIEGGRR